MAFGWEDYLSLANDLSSRQNNEAAFRSAVSRAYYAAFNIAKDFLNGLDETKVKISESTPSVHHAVWNEFLHHGGQTWTAVYRYGDALKKKRGDADYTLKPRNPRNKPRNWPQEAQQSINDAKMVLYWVRNIAEQLSKQ